MSVAGRVTMTCPHLELRVVDLGQEPLVCLVHQTALIPTTSLAKNHW